MRKRQYFKNLESYTSNLIRDEEMTIKFLDIALHYSRNLYSKYYSICRAYQPEDVVQEVCNKIMRQDISYDSEKNKTFNGFVHMLVERKYIDLSRKVKKENDNMSTDEELYNESTMILLDVLKSGNNPIDSADENIMLEGFFNKLPDESKVSVIKYINGVKRKVPLNTKNIIKMKMEGMSVSNIAKYFEVTSLIINNILKNDREFLWEICNDYMGNLVELPEY